MILKAILCVKHFCSFGAMLFIVNLLIKMIPPSRLSNAIYGNEIASLHREMFQFLYPVTEKISFGQSAAPRKNKSP